MFSHVLNFLLSTFQAVFSWFHSLLNVSSSMDAFLGVFFIAMSYRFLLAPIFGGGLGGSDRAKGRKKNDSSGG